MGEIEPNLRHRLERYFANVRNDASMIDEAKLTEYLLQVISSREKAQPMT